PLIYQGISASKRKEMVITALDRVGLADRVHHMPNQLSGGQQQRVSIARALAANPPVILADEPTGALDSKTGKDVMKFLMGLNDSGKTIILITHDNGIAECAKRIIRIHDGKIISDAPNIPKLENLE
ncbi:MAG: ATP-binding cassette domain-containing protein, partial [Oscillospiraceae bacterium]|nr:ATP-binding cassette domain-containing protein [Oscillospiraceae bacterium]